MTAALVNRISCLPPVLDASAAARARARLAPEVYSAWSEADGFLDGVFSNAPYLSRLARRHQDVLAALSRGDPETLCNEANADALAAADEDGEAGIMAGLRQAKAKLHLTAALADLAGAWDVETVTGALSDFADAACRGALRGAAQLTGFDVGNDPANPVRGVFLLALGKHGAQTLNYSSDIDPVALWEPELAEPPPGKEPRRAFAKLIQTTARLLSEITADGYVFRVDLRLRPDPGSTPVAVNATMARRYFEALGQNWERAAYAKARYCAGDAGAASAFLADLEPFIWRRTLDFAAVADIRALARQIQSVGDRADLISPGHDLKLGRGGIREIEFYAQVLQLVFGGRRPALRQRDTVKALGALADADLIDSGEAVALVDHYRFLRAAEHRIQMLQDEQSQTLPHDDVSRAHVAALMGWEDLAAFDADVERRLRAVHQAFSTQFEDDESLATPAGSLVLTGVEPTPDTLATLQRYGFSQAGRVWTKLAGWAAGKAKAARSPRARALFSRFAPRLVEALGETGDADAAFTRFAAFFEGLPSGVQVLSLLINHPELTRELMTVLGQAPRLAQTLGQRPAVLDVMLDPAFATPLSEDDPRIHAQRFEALCRLEFEPALNAARCIVREEKFRIGAQLLLRRATASQAARAFSSLAEASVIAMSQVCEQEVARRHGPPPGRWAVIGLGKLGGRELSADSDLDLVVVFDAEAELSSGSKPLGPEAWFARFTQRLIAALSAPTEEGELYEVDLALRPDGNQGSVATRLARFEKYYADEAWTYERMALTRARVIAASPGFAPCVDAAITEAAMASFDADAIRRDAADMRARLERDRPAKSIWDLKLRPGGLIDIEFIAQTGQLAARRSFSPTTREALESLATAGLLNREDLGVLMSAAEDYGAVTGLLRVAHGSGFDPEEASRPFAERLAVAAGCADLEGLVIRLDSHARSVRRLFEAYVGVSADSGDG
ncbi:MAG: bifunctional [glutamine synthetase] adenylyltransferase/[glutamine synthetase]-adenylyl-L-tyrosine phosphorylase [Pseudomonadota bacterium]